MSYGDDGLGAESDDEETGEATAGVEHMDGVRYEFITNQMGNKKFYANDFGFFKARCAGATTTWRCEFGKAFGCSATASTVQLVNGSQLVKRVSMDHTHPVQPDRKEKFVGR